MAAEDRPEVNADWVKYPGHAHEQTGYLVRPAVTGAAAGVVLIHENRGLDEHMKRVARNLAAEGFVVLAVDALSADGGTPEDADAAREAIGALDADVNIANQVAAVAFLADHPATNGRIGCLGFCWGGGVANQVAVHSDRLAAGVVYYGRSPASEDVARIGAPMLLHYAEHDDRINATVPDYQAALDRAGTRYELHRYAGAQHAFHNDTRTDRHDPEAAALAWRRTVAFLTRELNG